MNNNDNSNNNEHNNNNRNNNKYNTTATMGHISRSVAFLTRGRKTIGAWWRAPNWCCSRGWGAYIHA